MCGVGRRRDATVRSSCSSTDARLGRSDACAAASHWGNEPRLCPDKPPESRIRSIPAQVRHARRTGIGLLTHADFGQEIGHLLKGPRYLSEDADHYRCNGTGWDIRPLADRQMPHARGRVLRRHHEARDRGGSADVPMKRSVSLSHCHRFASRVKGGVIRWQAVQDLHAYRYVHNREVRAS
jgi:hypothetical protein